MKRVILSMIAIVCCVAGAMAQPQTVTTSVKDSSAKTDTMPANADKALLASAATQGQSAPADPRSKALEVAGAFTNEGFKIRDGHYDASIELGKPQVIDVNLYAGNQYWFCVGALPPGKKLSVTVYDENGKKVQSEPYQDENMAAAGIVAEYSGRYYVEVTLEEGQKTEYSFLYAYK